MSEETINKLTINYLTEEQYQEALGKGEIDENQIYCTPDTEETTENNKEEAKVYDLSLYKETGLTILRSSCIVKDKRVCVNFVGTLSMGANTTTQLFVFPTELRPKETKDFVAFGQSSNDTAYVGYGYITNTGLLQVRFANAISSYMRFSFVYDLD